MSNAKTTHLHAISHLSTYVILCITQLQVTLERHTCIEIFLDEKISAFFFPSSRVLGSK